MDLSALSPSEAEARGDEAVTEFARRPVDPSQEPPVRAQLVRTGEREWLFTVVMHHLVCDGESLHVFYRELADLYGGQEVDRLPPVPDPSAAQRSLEGPAHAAKRAADLENWRTRLADLDRIPPLPTDRPRSGRQGFEGARHTLALPPDWADRARAAAAAHSVSLFDVVLASWAVVLGRFSRSEDVVVGTTVSMRAEARATDAIGFFMRTVPLRLRVDAERPVRELLAGAHGTVVNALTHSGVEFDEIVRVTGHTGTGTAPLFQAALELHHDGEPPRFDGLRVEPLLVESTSAAFDLTLHLSTDPRTADFLEYSTELYSPGTAASLGEALGAVLAAVGDRPEEPVGALPVLGPGGAARVERFAEGPALPAVLPPPPAAAVRAAALRHPRRRAVLCREPGGLDEVDFGGLMAMADTLAERLAAAGVGPGQYVGIALPRSVAQIAALFGCWAAGAVAVPLDLRLPEERLRRMTRTADVRVVVVADAGRPPAGLDGARAVGVPAPVRGAGAAPVPLRPVRARDVAYAVFTSGSTGEPRPVAVSHRSLAAFGAAMDRLVFSALPASSVVAVNAPLHFDASLQNICLLGPATVCWSWTRRAAPIRSGSWPSWRSIGRPRSTAPPPTRRRWWPRGCWTRPGPLPASWSWGRGRPGPAVVGAREEPAERRERLRADRVHRERHRAADRRRPVGPDDRTAARGLPGGHPRSVGPARSARFPGRDPPVGSADGPGLHRTPRADGRTVPPVARRDAPLCHR